MFLSQCPVPGLGLGQGQGRAVGGYCLSASTGRTHWGSPGPWRLISRA